VREKYRKASSKPVALYNTDGSVYSTFPGIRVMAKVFNYHHKTINKTSHRWCGTAQRAAIKLNTLFQGKWYVKHKPK
jgi:hypothetical protein